MFWLLPAAAVKWAPTAWCTGG